MEETFTRPVEPDTGPVPVPSMMVQERLYHRPTLTLEEAKISNDIKKRGNDGCGQELSTEASGLGHRDKGI